MLKFEKIIHTEYVHLGDIINIIQHHHDKPTIICGNYICWCCDNSLKNLTNFILKLLPYSKIKYCENILPNFEEVVPIWVINKIKTIEGKKNIILPTYKKSFDARETDEHIVISFCTRSGYKHRAKSLGLSPKLIEKAHIEIILKKFKNKKIYNLGDEKIEGTISMIGSSLEEKYCIISKAKKTITTDNGIAHLGLMTNTEVFVVHQPIWNPSLYYPVGTNFIPTNILEKNYDFLFNDF